MPGPSSLAKDNLTISISKLDINQDTVLMPAINLVLIMIIH